MNTMASFYLMSDKYTYIPFYTRNVVPQLCQYITHPPFTHGFNSVERYRSKVSQHHPKLLLLRKESFSESCIPRHPAESREWHKKAEGKLARKLNECVDESLSLS